MAPGMPAHMLSNVYWTDVKMCMTATMDPMIFPWASIILTVMMLNSAIMPITTSKMDENMLDTLNENLEVCAVDFSVLVVSEPSSSNVMVWT